MEYTAAQTPAGRLIFALDIGTRSVIGMVGHVREDGVLNIVASDVEEYQNRAVVDGQIENINETAKIAAIVKQRLEGKLNLTLKDVYIAAAGRTLKTQQGSFEMDLDGEPIEESLLVRLESSAVSEARKMLFGGEDDETAFFCTGHSVIKYELDNYEMSTLLGHRGKRVSVTVIATFLPREVVESLYATMRRIGLNVSGLTLEPIAAMNAVIPADIRMLNLALVDIGAGTSDIAICNGGCVSAYTMATIAGDEVTEALMREYLVDFTVAERMKRALGEDVEIVSYENILGILMEETKQSLKEKMASVLRDLSDEICQRILESNGKAPSAVFLAGGGSQVAGLCEMVAEGLSLDQKRVALGGSNYMKKNVVSELDIFGPEYATPVGIAVTAALSQNNDPFIVSVNHEKLRLLNNWDMSVLDVLMLSGVQYSQIMGHVGKSISFQLNGERKTIRGKLPGQVHIELNGQNVVLSQIVNPGDQITFQPAEPGADAAPMLSEVIENWDSFTVNFLGEEIFVGTVTTVNNQLVTVDRPVANADDIIFESVITVGDLCHRMDVDVELLLLNGNPAQEDTLLQRGDVLKLVSGRNFGKTAEKESSKAEPKAADSVNTQNSAAAKFQTGQSQVDQSTETAAELSPETIPELKENTDVSGQTGLVSAPEPVREEAKKQNLKTSASASEPKENATIQKIEISKVSHTATGNREIQVTLNGAELTLKPREDKGAHQFLELLNYVDIDLENPQGNIALRLNGREATYLDVVLNGDRAEIFWEN